MRDPNGTHIPEPRLPAHHWPHSVDFGELASFADDIEGMGPNDVASRRASPAFSRGEELARAESDALGWQLRNALEVLAEVRRAAGTPCGVSLVDHVRKLSAYGGKLSELRQILEVQNGDALIPTAIERMRQIGRFRHDQATPERRQLAIIAALKNDLAAARAKLERQTEKTEAMANAALYMIGALADVDTRYQGLDDAIAAFFARVAREWSPPAEDETPARHGTDSVYG